VGLLPAQPGIKAQPGSPAHLAFRPVATKTGEAPSWWLAKSGRDRRRGGGENDRGARRWHVASILGSGEEGNSSKNALHVSSVGDP
jgi:hypothetical protein